VINSTSCFAVSKLLNIDFDNYKKSIEDFNTVDRRLQMKYKNDVIVYDDYAHHPVEIEFSLNALKDTYSDKKITAVFQPHLFTRTRDFYKEFAVKLKIADEIVLLDIYPAREQPIENVTSELIYNELVKSNSNVKYFADKKEIINYLAGNISKEHVIVFIGAGDITLLCDEFVKQAELKKN
jgi:UDP-N-acetylmuramate--alanine ligase